jgi:F-box and WD-40 domain protein CDC4
MHCVSLIVQCPPYAAASGSLDGAVRLWDLVTGTCTHRFKWHDDAIVQLATSLQYLISLSQDDNVCIWERTKAQLLHKIAMVRRSITSLLFKLLSHL